ncbi:ATPase domain-containing protein [Phaeobacter gallaeciensis]|uniref:ATPase domain-containing protein n=1 Tax=Phaeobacter gallaeciensis TaxID=60890 RepID=UPI000BBC5F3E|nr:ATPase domain-containing protein [Phaeobacter gallaeciensis]ATF19458.1 circadian clock protein KaiC [Phaeobacter gallaeciensis]ATF23567.1 circadian clock protein KaiC [Phaeobacter gallaeciensis]
MSTSVSLPYHDIAEKLLRSTLRAFGEFVKENGDEYILAEVTDVRDAQINRHFSWITVVTGDNEVRHLRAGSADEALSPLQTKSLRNLSELKAKDPSILEALRNGESIQDPQSSLVQANPTRISRIIKNSIEATFEESSRKSRALNIPSPYQIVADFLTIPEHPGSRAYALLTMRTVLFQRFGAMPKTILKHGYDEFTVQDLETAYNSLLTSMEERYRSRGQDKLDDLKPHPEAGLRPRVSGILRHYLAMTGVLNLRVKPSAKFPQSPAHALWGLSQLCDVHTVSIPLEFARPQYLKAPTEFSELVNSLWGIPLPIRGADTIFRGGLNFASRGGLVCALHGGAGSGKTALALGIGASLSGFGIRTLFLTAEEDEADLHSRAASLLPSKIRSLPFVPDHSNEWLRISRFELVHDEDETRLRYLSDLFEQIASALEEQNCETEINDNGVPLPCSTMVVLDGLHEIATQALFDTSQAESKKITEEFHRFIETCRKLRALVVLTTGTDWRADTSLDYLVDVAMRLSHETESDIGSKPHRYLTLSKARHQLCSPGTHGLQIAGDKGVRFTPQMNYQLDRMSIWNSRLPFTGIYKEVMQRTCRQEDLRLISTGSSTSVSRELKFFPNKKAGVELYRGSNIFLNGEGSGGKAGLALKIATAPSFQKSTGDLLINRSEKVLVVSFLYPEEYYRNILDRLRTVRNKEYEDLPSDYNPRMEVMHLYPGHLKPDTLYSKIEWALRASLLSGDPFTTIVIDGIHNVFLQFPEIEKQSLFWPQLFSLLRTRNLTSIITHTLLSVRLTGRKNVDSYGAIPEAYRTVDDSRSDPLKHALVLKTDFRLEVDPKELTKTQMEVSAPHTFRVETHSAIGQPMPDPDRNPLYWSREQLVFFSEPQGAFL